MDTTRICPGCQKTLAPGLPLGLCPECLIRAGFNTGTETGPAPADKPRFQPPTLAELSKHFPQLEILEFIGQGGMGAVYKARQKQLDRTVALKILPPQVASGPGFAERFTREVRALAKLNHPHIVTLYEFGQTDGLFYFLMEFVDGVNLRQLLNNSRISPPEALAIVPQICDALQYAHDRGIVHRDIKPENIMLNKDGDVKIADFGVAKIVEDPDQAGIHAPGEAGELTEAGSVLGTPQYMAPEQVAHPLAVDHRADIYALGVVFYQMLTGELPAGKFDPPSRKVQIDVRLDEVVLRALENKPELRYQQAGELKTHVETILTTPPKTPLTQKESKPMNKKTAAAIAIVVLLLTAAGYASWFTLSQPNQKNPTVSEPVQTNQNDQDTFAATNQSGFQMTIELRDGSRVVGKGLDDTLSFHSASLGDLKLAVSGIRSIAMAEDGVTARVTEANGDVLDVQFTTSTLRVLTGFGKTELPVKLIKSIRVSAVSNPGQMPSGLVALWSGEGNADDSVGGNNGQLVGNIGFMPGKVGQAFNFNNGIGAVNFPRVIFLQDFSLNRGGGYGYVQIPASPALDVGKGDGFTFECWIKPVSVTQEMLIAEYERALGTYDWADVGFNFAIHPSSVLDANLVDDTANHSAHEIITPPNLLIADVWQHIALTYDKASGIAVIYINGAVAVQSNLGSFTPQTGFPYLLFGARTTFGSVSNPRSVFSGGMDEIGIYNRALSAEEIQTIYNSGNPIISVPPPANPPKPNIPTTVTTTNETGFGLTIELRDGSRVAGKSLDESLRFHSASLGDMKFSVADIRAIVMADDGVTARLTATNGDMLDVQFVTPTLRVETGFGKTELPVKLIRSLKISSLGKPRYLPPGLVGVWFDEGNGIFNNIGQSSAIVVPNSPSLVSMQQTRQLTFAVWIKPTSLSPVFPVLLSKGGNRPGGAYGGYEFLLNAHGDNDLLFVSGGCEFVTRNANGRWINQHLGEWIHVAFTIDDRTKTAQFYINGQPTNDAFNEGTSDDLNFDLPNNLYIGMPDPASNTDRAKFDGAMRDLTLFNRALTADEIQTIYNADQPSNASFPP
jgi:serine/threonine protein kinase